MLTITIPDKEAWDEINECFMTVKGQTISLEHSLVSISKWESKWHKPFLENKDLSTEEILDYIRCMTLTKNVNPEIYNMLDNDTVKQITDYISNPMTATWFTEKEGNKRKGKNQVITSEIVYYWMVSLQIPMECQRWHFNRLMTLIRVCNEKNAPQKKMSKREIMNKNRALNEARKRSLNTNG